MKPKIFLSYSFAECAEKRTRAWKELVECVLERIEQQTAQKGAKLQMELVEGNKADLGNPVESIFPKVRSCDFLIALLLNVSAESRIV